MIAGTTLFATDFASSELKRVLERVRFIKCPITGQMMVLGDSGLDPRVRRVLASMYFRVDQRLVLDELARGEGLSVGRLIHLFKDQVELPPKRCLKCFRLIRAKELILEEPQLSVKEVAARVGFCSSAFIREFKETFGVRPGTYRRIVQNERIGDFPTVTAPAITERSNIGA